jgi:hypothetical protein
VLAELAGSMKSEALKAQKAHAGAEKQLAAVALLADRAREARAIDVLVEVTKALPDDTWVSIFELNGNELHLIGTSTSAASLIERLSAGPLFDHPRFRAAITPQAASRDKGAERFDVAVTVIREVAKAVLGDMLGLNYVVSPAVQGNVTLKINRPLTKDEIIPALNTVFQLSGATIKRRGGESGAHSRSGPSGGGRHA